MYAPTAEQRWLKRRRSDTETAGNQQNDVLLCVCRHYTGIMSGWLPIPATAICRIVGKSVYQTRKELRNLRDLGLVVFERHCLVGEYGNELISGWRITDKAKESPEYKQAWAEERKIRQEVFGEDIGEEDKGVDSLAWLGNMEKI